VWGVTVSGGGVSTPYTSWFMFILCEFFAVPGREGPGRGGGGARAGGEESSANKIRAVGAEADTRHLA
jgi:hypothetical protein